MSAELLAIRAVADLREQRATLINEGGPGMWYVDGDRISGPGYAIAKIEDHYNGTLTEHIASEANPSHSLAAVRRWRGVVKRHKPGSWQSEALDAEIVTCQGCQTADDDWPCPDLTETADEARAYLGGDAS